MSLYSVTLLTLSVKRYVFSLTSTCHSPRVHFVLIGQAEEGGEVGRDEHPSEPEPKTVDETKQPHLQRLAKVTQLYCL